MGEEPTYSEQSKSSEEMGGRVLLPKYEEINDVWYVDFQSLYPHIFCMFNLFNEKDPKIYDNLWHGNDFFKVKGHYDVSNKHILAGHVSKLLKQRVELKEKDKKHPMVYCLKIFLNGLYGVIRSSIFEKVHTPNAGWDCCWLGQQIHEFVEKQMIDYGFEIIQGDTDSLFCKALDEKNNNIEYVKKCLNEIVMIINDNVPFPIDTFKLNIETYIDYLMCPFSEQAIIDEATGKNKKEGNRLIKERKGAKKNYLYIYKDKEGKSDVKLVGLPIIKSNATKLGIKIYEEVLKPKILEQKTAKFKREFVDNILNEYLQREDILKLIAREFKVNPAKTYKLKSQIQSQISQGYLDGGSGVIELIKNNKVGKAGKGQKYCTIKEAIENKLTYKDIDLEKVYNEIEPFIKFEPELIETKQVTKIKNKSKS
jgi:DNA polymerase elongation subunit (family B)